MKKIVWILSEGSPGHVSQSQGLVDALAQLIPLQSYTIFARTSVRGWQRHFLRLLMGKKGHPLPETLLHRTVRFEHLDTAPPPDLIISSGGKSVFAGRTLALKYKVPYIFIGERKPYPAQWFSLIISPVPNENTPNSLPIERIPVPVTPEKIDALGTADPALWCMIVGGASRSHPFSEADWKALALGMNQLAEKHQIRWLLTTSRRTGLDAENTLQKHINSEHIEDAIWWSQNPRKELQQFMARSTHLFVTQDSVTMVSEAVASGRPTLVIAPQRTTFPEDSFLPLYYQRLEEKNRILRCTTLTLFQVSIPFQHTPPENELNSIAETILKRLDWTQE